MSGPVMWPRAFLVPRSLSVVKMPASMKGNPSQSGFTQVMASRAGRWKIIAKMFPLDTPARVRVWRAIEGSLGGMLGQVVFELGEVERTPAASQVDPPPSVPHGDGASFSDGAGYVSQLYGAESGGDVAAGGTEVTIVHRGFPAPLPGQLFTAGVRLYAINRIVSASTDAVTVSIWPPARQQIMEGQTLRFDRPRVLCRLATDDEMAVEEMEVARWGFGDITFIEDTGPVIR